MSAVLRRTTNMAARTIPQERSPQRRLETARGKQGRGFWQSPWTLSCASAVGLFAALPPLELAFLAWVAPLGWLLLIRRRNLAGSDAARRDAKAGRLRRLLRRPCAAIWCSGFLFWMLTCYWLTLPHWATNLGLPLMSLYLGVYTALFVGLSRVAVHGWRVPLVLAAPCVWTGMELLRGYALGGFGMANLAHTQYRWLTLVQCSDLAGAYGLSFLIMFVASCLAAMVPDYESAADAPRVRPNWRGAWLHAGLAVAAIGAATGYGYWRLASRPMGDGRILRVALIQGTFDTDFQHDPDKPRRIFEAYLRLSEQAIDHAPPPQLIVWPESMLGYPYFTFAPGATPPPEANMTREQFARELSAADARQRELLGLVAGRLRGAPVLLGANVRHFGPGQDFFYNAALLFDGKGRLTARYDKTHAVMFGEYVPLGNTFPWLYRLMPFRGIQEGDGPRRMQVEEFSLVPSICYESILPHLIAGQVRHFRQLGQEPDVLVNLTNDGWFWGSSELQLHLICGVFRAVECRKPLVIAANTGISAHIDADGRIVQQGPRRAEAVLHAEVVKSGMDSPYLWWGDAPASGCLLLSLAAAAWGIWQRRRGVAGAALAV